jgi:L-arabinose isomerase
MNRFMPAGLGALCLALTVIVAAQQSSQPTPSTALETGVAARVGDRVITVKEVDEAWRTQDPVEHTRATQALYDGRRGTLDRLIADMLIEQAAKARGVSVDQYTKDEIGKRSKPVTDTDVNAFYEANKSRMQGKPLEEMRGAIRAFLEQQQTANARQELVTELRKAGPAIRTLLEPPRQVVEIAAHDPVRGGAKAPVTIVEFSDYQ